VGKTKQFNCKISNSKNTHEKPKKIKSKHFKNTTEIQKQQKRFHFPHFSFSFSVADMVFGHNLRAINNQARRLSRCLTY